MTRVCCVFFCASEDNLLPGEWNALFHSVFVCAFVFSGMGSRMICYLCEGNTLFLACLFVRLCFRVCVQG
jgi:hypothetical protein